MLGRLGAKPFAQSRRYFEGLLSISGQQESLSKYLLVSIADALRRVFVAQFQFSQAHARGQVFICEQLLFEMRLVAAGQLAQQETTNRFIGEISFVTLNH